MENDSIINIIKENFINQVISVDEGSDMLTLSIEKNAVYNIIAFLKNELGFNFLTDLCGIHYPDQKLPLGVIYHLHNMIENKRLRLKTFISVDEPKIKSCVDIFSCANWMERETFDFYGIIFENHPNLKRILNVEYMDYFPMRKEYPLEDATRKDKEDIFFGR